MTAIERLAKLAYESMPATYAAKGMIYPPNWEGEGQGVRDDWVSTLRAVVEGMRYPSAEMVKAGRRHVRDCDIAWSLMIGHILDEKP